MTTEELLEAEARDMYGSDIDYSVSTSTSATAKADAKAEATKTESDSSTFGQKLWKFFTEADKWFGMNLYETLHGPKNFTLTGGGKGEGKVNYLPLYVQRHIANDFYTKMFSQLYPDPPVETQTESSKSGIVDRITGAISNAAGSAVSRVTNAVANQITATSNYARNLISTMTFGLVDTSQSVTPGKNMSHALLLESIPHLDVTEIRLNDKLTQKGIVFTCIGKMWKAGVTDGGNAAEGKDDEGFITRISNGFTAGLKEVCNQLIHMTPEEWLAKMSSGSVSDAMATRIGGLAYSFIRNGASGEYMNTYQLPHFGTYDMLHSLGGGFQGQAPSDNPILESINSAIGNSLVIQENILWECNAKSKSMGDFTGTFHLFNDNLDMYAENLDLILRLVTHNMPIRDSFMYRAPCCYDVTDVGNRRCYFCSGDFSVKKIGKIRRLSSSYANSGKSGILKKIKERILTPELPSDDVNDDYINYVPDAFEIHYKFTPIISESYNTFVYYFLSKGGDPSTSVLPVYGKGKDARRDTTSTSYGSKIDYMSDKLMKGFADAFSNAVR